MAESAYDYKKLSQLEQEEELYKRDVETLSEDSNPLEELDRFKREVGITWKNSFSI